jgi:calcineurin-like phosphoesterase family protein
MIEVYGDTLLSSDWHVLHRNIYWFLPAQRAALSGATHPKQLSAQECIDAECVTYRRVLERLESLIASSTPVKRFLFLGDLVFGLNRHGGAVTLVETLRQKVPCFFEIFRILGAAGIRRILVLGNHDDFKLRNRVARALYEELFDEVTLFVRDGQALFTHFPIGYSRATDATQGTPDEKYYRMHKSFHKLDTRLLCECADAPIVNFHGHIHVGPFLYPVANVVYRNVALDVLSSAGQPRDGGSATGSATNVFVG